MESIEHDEVIKIKSFDWDKAKHFYYVAKFQSVSEASKFLHTSQSSMSRKIILLEEALNCQLLIRNRHGVTPTRKGEELFAIIEDTFLRLKHFNYNSTSMSHNGQKRRIRISTTHAIAAYILNSALLDFEEIYPEIAFEVIVNDHLIDLVINDVDIAIRPYDNTTSDIEQEYLFTLQKRLYASPKYIEKHGEPQIVEDLKNHYIIAPAESKDYPYADIEWILKVGLPKGQKHEPIYTSNSLECLVEAACKGMGIIGGYENMQVIQSSNLKNILPGVKEKAVKFYFTYPKLLVDDKIISLIKHFVCKKLYNNSNYKPKF